VTVSADDAAPTGSVTVTVARADDRHPYEKSVRLRDGHAALRLPPLTRAGIYEVTVAYPGTADFAPSEATTEIEVRGR
jgi:hypothetical protein